MEIPHVNPLATRPIAQENGTSDAITPYLQQSSLPAVTRLGSTVGHYQYRPLKPGETRILKLRLPTSPKSKRAYVISGKIIHVSVNSLPKYEALSYAWGSEYANESISIDGKSLVIRSNLAAALRQFRQDFASSAFSQPSWHQHLPRRMRNYRRIWIDAICINQADVDERNQQIQLMCHIYTHCSRLIVWLGPTSEDSQIAADFLELLGQKSEDDDDLKPWAAELLASASFIHTYIAVLRVFSSPWFGRAWIFQEYILGAKGIASFQHGRHQISEDAMMATNNILFVEKYFNLSVWRKIPQVAEILENSEWYSLQYQLITQWSEICTMAILSAENLFQLEDFPLLHHLNSIRQTTSTDPRDKVYATLGVLGFRYEPSGLPTLQFGKLVIDYNASVQDVYSSVVAELIFQTKRLHVLLACGQRGPLVQRTWTPDWTTTTYQTGFLAWVCGHFDIKDLDDPGGFRSSALLDCTASFSGDPSVLTVAGLQWAVVGTVSPSFSPSARDAPSQETSLPALSSDTFLSYCQHCWATLDSSTTARNEADVFKVFWKTLLINRYGNIYIDWTEATLASSKNDLSQAGVPADNDAILVHAYDLVLDLLWKTCQETPVWSHPALLAALEDHFRAWERIFITTKGLIGKFFEETIQAGDIVCVILGCPAPLLLRPVGTQFEVLGGVYLDGIMFGEAIEAMERGEVELRDFELI
ncbi:hypothetical protein IFR05_016021 [Cadophora sp. M221]|nr:hypothetical protein IFR05_016021 [Cadophora sp. M221]